MTSRLITPARRNATVAVINDQGLPVSWHATRAAAARKVASERRALKRYYGRDTSCYLPRSIVTVPAEGAYIRSCGADWYLA